MTRYSTTMRDALAKVRGENLQENIQEAPEYNMPASPDEGGMAKDQLEFMKYAADEIMQHIENGGEFPEWMQNKLSGTFEKMKSLHANIDHSNVESVKEEFIAESVDLEEGAMNKMNQAGKDLARYAAKDKKDIDYNDFMKAAAMMTKGKVDDLVKFTNDLDTEPRDVIIMQVKDALGKDAAEKLFKVRIRDEYEPDMQETSDPKIVKAVDNLKKGDTVEIEYDSSIKKGHKGKFKVTAKNTVNKGRTVKTTLQNLANPSGVKHYIYQYKDRDGAYFAIGDMGASMVSLKAGYGEELEEGKSSTGYELYHRDFSSAMRHAYDFAKKKFGIEVDPKEIDDKVASGPRKPSKGKTNSYRLLGKDGKKAIQVQVYGMDNGKYELNMYKEGVEPIQWPSQPLEEKLKVSDGLGAWIDDFKKSDAPQFKGKSDEEKKNMAIAAFTDAGGKLDEAVLSGRDYKVKDGKVHISKANFKKVSKDYKNDTRGKERMVVLDPKTQATVSMPVIFEETDLNELREPFVVVDTADGNKVVGTASDEKGAKSIITSAELPPMKIKDKKTLKIVKVKKKQMIGYPLKEEGEPDKPDTAKAVDQMRDDKKKTRIAQLQLQIAKAQETINKLNAQEKPNG